MDTFPRACLSFNGTENWISSTNDLAVARFTEKKTKPERKIRERDWDLEKCDMMISSSLATPRSSIISSYRV